MLFPRTSRGKLFHLSSSRAQGRHLCLTVRPPCSCHTSLIPPPPCWSARLYPSLTALPSPTQVNWDDCPSPGLVFLSLAPSHRALICCLNSLQLVCRLFQAPISSPNISPVSIVHCWLPDGHIHLDNPPPFQPNSPFPYHCHGNTSSWSPHLGPLWFHLLTFFHSGQLLMLHSPHCILCPPDVLRSWTAGQSPKFCISGRLLG